METLPAKEAAAAAVPSVMTGCVPEKGDSPCSPLVSPLFLFGRSFGRGSWSKRFLEGPPLLSSGSPSCAARLSARRDRGRDRRALMPDTYPNLARSFSATRLIPARARTRVRCAVRSFWASLGVCGLFCRGVPNFVFCFHSYFRRQLRNSRAWFIAYSFCVALVASASKRERGQKKKERKLF